MSGAGLNITPLDTHLLFYGVSTLRALALLGLTRARAIRATRSTWAIRAREIRATWATRATWSRSAVQKIQKLSESPVTSHVVAKICANNSTNVINQTPMHAPISMGLKMGDKVNLATR